MPVAGWCREAAEVVLGLAARRPCPGGESALFGPKGVGKPDIGIRHFSTRVVIVPGHQQHYMPMAPVSLQVASIIDANGATPQKPNRRTFFAAPMARSVLMMASSAFSCFRREASGFDCVLKDAAAPRGDRHVA